MSRHICVFSVWALFCFWNLGYHYFAFVRSQLRVKPVKIGYEILLWCHFKDIKSGSTFLALPRIYVFWWDLCSFTHKFVLFFVSFFYVPFRESPTTKNATHFIKRTMGVTNLNKNVGLKWSYSQNHWATIK